MCRPRELAVPGDDYNLFSRKVMGYASVDHMRAELCVQALDQTAHRRGVSKNTFKGLILHSDRGVHLFRSTCAGYGILQSMSNKGDCYDNAQHLHKAWRSAFAYGAMKKIAPVAPNPAYAREKVAPRSCEKKTPPIGMAML